MAVAENPKLSCLGIIFICFIASSDGLSRISESQPHWKWKNIMAHDYLADLNEEQRRAVRHGVKDGSAVNSPPLLVIAGAGSGKTKTLAHRVAHLVVNGIHPQRILQADLLSAGRPRDDGPGKKDYCSSHGHRATRPALGWHVPRHRCSRSARVCPSHWIETNVHYSRPVRRRRSDGCGAA